MYKNLRVGKFKTGRIILKSPEGENNTGQIQSCIQNYQNIINLSSDQILGLSFFMLYNQCMFINFNHDILPLS